MIHRSTPGGERSVARTTPATILNVERNRGAHPLVRAIIFDYFDVISPDGFNQWMQRYGYRREGAFAEASVSLDRGEISFLGFFGLLGEASGQPAQAIEHEIKSVAKPNAEVVSILRELRTSYQLALLSNAESTYLRGELAEHDLEKYFDLIVISSEVGMAKPEPEIFAHILGKLDLDASEVIFVDDNSGHIDSARMAGINGVVFTDAQSLRRDLGTVL